MRNQFYRPKNDENKETAGNPSTYDWKQHIKNDQIKRADSPKSDNDKMGSEDKASTEAK